MNNLVYEVFKDFGGKIYVYKGVNYCNNHFHQQLEIIYVLEGEVQVCINNVTKKLSSDQLAVADCFDNHSYYKNDSNSFVLIIPIIYLNKYTNYMAKKQFVSNFLLEKKEAILIKKAMEDVASHLNENNILLSGYINVLLGLILKFMEIKDNSKKKYYELIKNILMYIEENHYKQISLNSISSYFGYSKYYFSRIFNEYIQCNLNDYVNLVRCRYIIHAIQNDNLSITEAAYKCGFTSVRTFYRTFKEIYNISPRDYFKLNI